MAVDAARKASMIQMEYASGFMQAIGSEKAFQVEEYTYQGNKVAFYKSVGDGLANDKVTAAKAAIKTIVDKGLALPPGVRFYCVPKGDAQNRAYGRDPAWNAIYYVVLGPATTTPSSVASISNQNNPGFTKGHVTCIHELGHILHMHRMGEDFYAVSSSGGCTGAPTGANAVQVSVYAGGAKKEFVAECFAGMMIGRTYSKSVMDEYRSYNGPE
jgi:hypothetical protein